MQNDLCHELPVRVKAGNKVIAATLQALVINSTDLIERRKMFAVALFGSQIRCKPSQGSF